MRLTTVKAGSWSDATIWDEGRVPALGDDATINHLVYALGNVVVGSGAYGALRLNMPLVCFGMLSVEGSVVGKGLYFVRVTETPSWMFYSSLGFELEPASEGELRDMWQNIFGNELEGVIFPVGGRVQRESFISPMHHAIITPVVEAARAAPCVYSAHHDPERPHEAIKVYCELPTDTSELAKLLSDFEHVSGAAGALGATLDIEARLITKPTVTLFSYLRRTLGESVLSVTEEGDRYVVWVRWGGTFPDTLAMLVKVETAIRALSLSFAKLGITKEIVGIAA